MRDYCVSPEIWWGELGCEIKIKMLLQLGMTHEICTNIIKNKKKSQCWGIKRWDMWNVHKAQGQHQYSHNLSFGCFNETMSDWQAGLQALHTHKHSTECWWGKNHNNNATMLSLLNATLNWGNSDNALVCVSVVSLSWHCCIHLRGNMKYNKPIISQLSFHCVFSSGHTLAALLKLKKKKTTRNVRIEGRR